MPTPGLIVPAKRGGSQPCSWCRRCRGAGCSRAGLPRHLRAIPPCCADRRRLSPLAVPRYSPPTLFFGAKYLQFPGLARAARPGTILRAFPLLACAHSLQSVTLAAHGITSPQTKNYSEPHCIDYARWPELRALSDEPRWSCGSDRRFRAQPGNLPRLPRRAMLARPVASILVRLRAVRLLPASSRRAAYGDLLLTACSFPTAYRQLTHRRRPGG